MAPSEAERSVYEQLDQLGSKGPSEVEVEGARARLLTRFWTGLRPQTGKAEAIGHADVTLGDYRRLFEAPRQYASIDVAAVRRAVSTYLTKARSNTVIARPLPGSHLEPRD